MAHVHFGDPLVREKGGGSGLCVARRGDYGIGNATVTTVGTHDEFALEEIRGELVRAVRLAVVRMNEDRSNLCVRIRVGKGLIGEQNQVLGLFRNP